MLRLVLSGGQTGADQAGWRASRKIGLATGGWMPLRFMTEDGPRPEFAELYGAREWPSAEYPPRTYANASDSNATVWFGSGDSRGFGCTMNGCRKADRPVLVIATRKIRPAEAADWLYARRIAVLNVAGNRESSSPGIGARVERFLDEMFGILLERDDLAIREDA